jgi:LPS-assembly lipoprotein
MEPNAAVKCFVPRNPVAAVFSTGLISLLLCVMLSSCGFHLRGTAGSAFQIPSLHLTAENARGELMGIFERNLASRGTRLVDSRDLAPWTMNIMSERFSRRVASTTGDISVAKYELILQVRFNLSASDGELLIPPATMVVERVYDYDSSNLVGSDAEERLLRQEMRAEIADSIIYRIGTTISSQATI